MYSQFGSARFEIRYLGPTADEIIRAFILFHYVCQAFEEGGRSLQQVANILQRWQESGILPAEIPTSVSTVQRKCFVTEKYFRETFGENAGKLLIRTGEGNEYPGLTEVGVEASQAIDDFLYRFGILEETL